MRCMWIRWGRISAKFIPMKTAISIDDQLLHDADRAAKQMGLSRSRLFSLALRDYLHQRRQQELLEKLNRVYAGGQDLTEQRTTAKVKDKVRRSINDRW
jgi:metal-responsive CopG/Arc/MetJ family transcriptional regulator